MAVKNGRQIRRVEKRKRTWGNIALHWIPFVFMFVAVVAGAAFAQHNADVREHDLHVQAVARCHVFKAAVESNRDTLVDLIEGAYAPAPVPENATEAQRLQYEAFNARQAIRKEQLIAGVTDDPLPDCSKSPKTHKEQRT